VKPFELSVRKVVPLVEQLAVRYQFEFFSIGGGLGIVYQPALASGEPTGGSSPRRNTS